MQKSVPPPSPELNRLRAAAAMIDIIELGLGQSTLSAERALSMSLFCEWAAEVTPCTAEEIKLRGRIQEGLERLKPPL